MNQSTNADLIAARIRDTNASAALKEFKLAVKRKEYVALSDVNKKLAEDVGRVRSKLLGLASRIAPRIAEKNLPLEDVKLMIDSVVYEALTELADTYTPE